MKDILDDPVGIGQRDPQNMLHFLGGFDRQLEQALEIGWRLQLPRVPSEIRGVVISGLGGSAAAGDFLQAYLGQEIEIPIWVNRNYSVPGFVNRETLSILCSYSGNTEETVSALRASHAVGAPIVCVSSGGTMGRLALEHGHSWAQIPGGQPPRSALGLLAFTCLAIMLRLSLIRNRDDQLRRSIEWVRQRIRVYGPEHDSSFNEAKKLARVLKGKIPFVYASQDRLEVVARRWCGQIAENGKQLSCWKALPEMNHNEVAGWKHPDDLLGRIVPVFLRDAGDHPRTQIRLDWTRCFLSQQAGSALEYWSEGENWLERLLMLILLGDYASVYLALLNQEDPCPVRAIDRLKYELRRFSEEEPPR